MNAYDGLQELLIAESRKRLRHYGDVLTFAEWEERRDAEPPLTPRQMVSIVDTAISMLQELYVHLDLKRTRRGVDPLPQLSVFRERLASPGADIAPRTFHTTMLEIFKSLGDVHTAYRLPAPHARAIAFLPFLVNAFHDNDATRRYMVSHTLLDDNRVFPGTPFCRGVEVTSWNGVPMGEAIKRAAEFEEGSNVPHDLALGMQFITLRWLGAAFAPDSPWVLVGYKDSAGVDHELKFWWAILLLSTDPNFLVASQAAAVVLEVFRPRQERQRALHLDNAIVHAGRMALFAPGKRKETSELDELTHLGNELMALFYGYVGREELRAFTERHASLKPHKDEFPSLLPTFLEAREHDAGHLIAAARAEQAHEEYDSLKGKRFGYIGIRAFPLVELQRGLFKYEFRRLLNLMPGDGLIVDVRDNPGGSATLAEEVLQFLTPNRITPLPFRFIATALTKKLAQSGSKAYREYARSIVTALGTGGRFSAARPITSVQRANALGQHYFGPVLLITNATTYSAADIFAAGFEDNDVGRILGLDETTGAGGANCWFYRQYIRHLLQTDPLPSEINMQFAVRQCLRVGKENAGVPIEEIGIPSQKLSRYALTREDILDARPWRLLLTAAKALSVLDAYDLETRLAVNDGKREVRVRTRNIDRLDFYVNGRPSSRDVTTGSTPFAFDIDGKVELEIRGFASAKGTGPVARYVQVFPV